MHRLRSCATWDATTTPPIREVVTYCPFVSARLASSQLSFPTFRYDLALARRQRVASLLRTICRSWGARFLGRLLRGEPVRKWLKALSREDKPIVGTDIATVEFGWPVGMPTCRPLASRVQTFGGEELSDPAAFKPRGSWSEYRSPVRRARRLREQLRRFRVVRLTARGRYDASPELRVPQNQAARAML
jgi:hypothetical protein